MKETSARRRDIIALSMVEQETQKSTEIVRSFNVTEALKWTLCLHRASTETFMYKPTCGHNVKVCKIPIPEKLL